MDPSGSSTVEADTLREAASEGYTGRPLDNGGHRLRWTAGPRRGAPSHRVSTTSAAG